MPKTQISHPCPVFRKNNSVKNFEKIIFMNIEKNKNLDKSTKGYKLEIAKLYETSFNFKDSDMAILTLPFYWNNKPVLGVFEREESEREKTVIIISYLLKMQKKFLLKKSKKSVIFL